MEWSASLVPGPWGNFPNIVICWEAAVWLDCILCLILTPDGHPPVQEIHAESGVCCPYLLRLAASLAVGRGGQVGLGSGSWPQREKQSPTPCRPAARGAWGHVPNRSKCPGPPSQRTRRPACDSVIEGTVLLHVCAAWAFASMQRFPVSVISPALCSCMLHCCL